MSSYPLISHEVPKLQTISSSIESLEPKAGGGGGGVVGVRQVTEGQKAEGDQQKYLKYSNQCGMQRNQCFVSKDINMTCLSDWPVERRMFTLLLSNT